MLHVNRYVYHRRLLHQFPWPDVSWRLYYSKLAYISMLCTMPPWYLLLPPFTKLNIANMCTVSMSTSSGLYPCPDVNGTATERYCCEDRSNTFTSNACCDTPTFELNIISGFSLFLPQGEVSFGNATSPLSLSPAMSSSVVTPSTSAYALTTSLAHSVQSSSSAQPAPSSKLPHSIGAGIGVPLAVLLFSAQSFILFREYRRRISVEKTMVDYRAANPRGSIVGTRDLHELHGRSMPRELECAHRQPGELYDGELYEVGASPRFREPPGNNSREDGERF